MVKKILLVTLSFFYFAGFSQVPLISSFTPSSGNPGTVVTIKGTNFATVGNVVYFGAVKAKVIAATATSLTVTVPPGATYSPISVTANGLTAMSPVAFIVTYPNGAAMFTVIQSFPPQTDLPIGAPGNSVASNVISADFDGDGKPDIAVLESAGGSIYIFKNSGIAAAPFNATPTLQLRDGVGDSYVTVADFDGDGKLDIATVNFSYEGAISVFKNTSTTGNLSFAASISLGGGKSPLGITSGDFNGDGKLDIATANDGTNTFSIFLNTSKNGIISFAAGADFPTGNIPYGIAAGDVDGDGKIDVVIPNHGDYNVSVIRNTSAAGGLSFAPKIDFNLGTAPISVSLGDIDGDGKIDVVTTNHLDFGEVKTGTVLRNTSTAGSISFAANVIYYTGVFSVVAQIADMDGDGKPDLSLVDKTSNVGLFVKNTSTPGNIILSDVKNFGKFTYPTGIAIGDFNADGKPDVAVSNGGSPNTLSILFNQENPLVPNISAFTPVTAGAGTTVKITGTNFTGATAVNFGGKPAASFVINSATGISAVVGADQSGTVQVTTPNGIGFVDGFTIIPKAVISKVTTGPSGTNNSVTITGIFFSGATAISFDGVAATSYVVNSANQISALTSLIKFSTITITTPGGVTTYNYVPSPTISSLSMLTGFNGASIVITGTNLTGATAVSFGGTAASSFKVNSPTSITAVVGAGSTGNVTVTTPGGSVSLPGFTYYLSPAISSFFPTGAKAGETVYITGTNLTGTTSVTFGGVKAASFVVNSPVSVSAVLSTGASGNLVVTTPGGSATAPGFIFNPLPVITSFTPTRARTGATVNITGSNLSGTTAVSFGGIPAASFDVQSSINIYAVVGKGASGNISLTTPAGSSSLAGFVFIPTPAITFFSPAHAKTGATVTITGTDLGGTTAVSFGGVPATSFTVISTTTITAVVGDASDGNVAVTTPDGSVSQPGFFYIPPPAITSFTPGNAALGQTVTISGSDFNNATAVSFGGVPAASFSVYSSGRIIAVVGSGAGGNVSVTSPGGTSALAGFVFDQSPAITSFTPAAGITGTKITITGTNFNGVTSVAFGNATAASFSIVSPTSIVAVVGNGSTGSVKVISAAGLSSLAGFTYKAPPIIMSFSPASAKAGDLITIKGFYFNGASVVSFGGVPATSFKVVSDTTITATVGTASGGSITVATPNGSTSQPGFVLNTSPAITSFSPDSAATGAVVTITGKNFTGATAVTFGNVPAASFTVVSATTIKATVGNGSSGRISVNTPFGTTALSGFSYRVVFPPDNFQVAISSVTCKGGNNGFVSISAAVKNSFYVATLTGNGIVKKFGFATSLHLDTLTAGTYSLCLTLYNQPSFSQCYSVVVTEPKDLSVYATVNNYTNSAILTLAGAQRYNISLNGALYTSTTDSIVNIPLIDGSNEIKVSTDRFCQGVVEKLINISNRIIPYPNPFQNTLKVNLGSKVITNVDVNVYNVSNSRLIYSKRFDSLSGVLQLDMTSFEKGIYAFHITMDNTERVFKIIKE